MPERIDPTSEEIQTQHVFAVRFKTAIEFIQTSDSAYSPYARRFLRALSTYGLVAVPTTKRYDQDTQLTSRNAFSPPFGLELNTLSHNVQLVLGLHMLYTPTPEDIAEAADRKIRPRLSGPQARLYILDGFPTEEITAEGIGANLLFVSHMADALLKRRYPLGQDQKSPKFIEQIHQAIKVVSRYTKVLTEEQKAHLSTYVRSISELDEEGINGFAQRFVAYQVEATKAFGIIEPGSCWMEPEDPDQTPFAAVVKKTEYLHCSDRNLPLVVGEQLPSLPWREYGRNRWNRDNQLFGRYEVAKASLRVDFRLDSTHFPAKYHFFDTVEITQGEGTERQQVIFGQKVNERQEVEEEQKAWADAAHLDDLFHKADFVFPIIRAGNFDFAGPARPYLEQLANDQGTKPDVRVVLGDILDLASKGPLWTVESYQRRN